jgi:hypothetical protein
MQLDSHVSNAHTRISNVPDTWVIMTYKTCGQMAPSWLTRRADMRLQCSADPVDHSQDTVTV